MPAVLVTGGSSGIGAAFCRKAAKDGWSVLVGYRSGQARAAAVAKMITDGGGKAWPVSLPLEDGAAVEAALAFAAEKAGGLDALALCASPAPALQSFLKVTPEALREQFEANAVGNQRLIAGAWKRFFSKSKKGLVLAVLSAAAGDPPWGHMTSYVAGKRALRSVLESALAELGPSGLRAAAVSPDYTDTPMLQSLSPLVLETVREKRGGKLLSPEVVADALAAFLKSPPAEPRLAIRGL